MFYIAIAILVGIQLQIIGTLWSLKYIYSNLIKYHFFGEAKRAYNNISADNTDI